VGAKIGRGKIAKREKWIERKEEMKE